jgi:shikimate kinase
MDPTAEPTRENLVLVGFMGTGKSTIGRQVARKLGFQFLDMDHVIVDREGAPVAQLFAERGEQAFRDLETSALRSLGHLSRMVVSTGGGAVVRGENRVILRALGFVVCLTASEEVIFERVARNQKRPLLQTEDPRGTIRALLAARAEAYREAAQVEVDTSALSPAQVVERIVTEARRAFSWHRHT